MCRSMSFSMSRLMMDMLSLSALHCTRVRSRVPCARARDVFGACASEGIFSSCDTPIFKVMLAMVCFSNLAWNMLDIMYATWAPAHAFR